MTVYIFCLGGVSLNKPKEYYYNGQPNKLYYTYYTTLFYCCVTADSADITIKTIVDPLFSGWI